MREDAEGRVDWGRQELRGRRKNAHFPARFPHFLTPQGGRDDWYRFCSRRSTTVAVQRF